MALKMAHADHRNIQGIGQRFCIVDPDEQSPCQARPLSDGNSGEISPCETGLLECRSRDTFNRFDVGTGGKFGNDASEPLVNIMLLRNNVREDGAVCCKSRCSRFIA